VLSNVRVWDHLDPLAVNMAVPELAPAALGGTVGAMTTPERPSSTRPVDYKGEPLDAERGPGLGCFKLQLLVLGILLVLTPLTVNWSWPFWVSAVLLFLVLLLLLITGQNMIFMLRLIAADRRDGQRHAPLASATKTVGELEDEAAPDPAETALGEPGADASGTLDPGVRE
jgi:hypothetical protein